jgi:hypothetical protein
VGEKILRLGLSTASWAGVVKEEATVVVKENMFEGFGVGYSSSCAMMHSVGKTESLRSLWQR